MLQHIIILSLVITAIHVCTWDGMILHKPAEIVGYMLDCANLSVLRKPLFECLICMGGIYTLLLDLLLIGLQWQVLIDIPAVIGLNTLIATQICKMNQ